MSARLQMHTPTHLHTFAHTALHICTHSPQTSERLRICTRPGLHVCTRGQGLKAAHIHPRPRWPGCGLLLMRSRSPEAVEPPRISTPSRGTTPSAHAPPLNRARAAARRHHLAEMIRPAWLVPAQIAPRGGCARLRQVARSCATPPASRSPARVARMYIGKNAPSEKMRKKSKKKCENILNINIYILVL